MRFIYFLAGTIEWVAGYFVFVCCVVLRGKAVARLASEIG